MCTGLYASTVCFSLSRVQHTYISYIHMQMMWWHDEFLIELDTYIHTWHEYGDLQMFTKINCIIRTIRSSAPSTVLAYIILNPHSCIFISAYHNAFTVARDIQILINKTSTSRPNYFIVTFTEPLWIWGSSPSLLLSVEVTFVSLPLCLPPAGPTAPSSGQDWGLSNQ